MVETSLKRASASHLHQKIIDLDVEASPQAQLKFFLHTASRMARSESGKSQRRPGPFESDHDRL